MTEDHTTTDTTAEAAPSVCDGCGGADEPAIYRGENDHRLCATCWETEYQTAMTEAIEEATRIYDERDRLRTCAARLLAEVDRAREILGHYPLCPALGDDPEKCTCLAASAVDGGGEKARVLVDQYAAEDPADGDYGSGVRRNHAAPEAFDALRAVVGLDAEVDRRIVAALSKSAPARPAPTEEPGETEFQAARPGVDYCGATHPEHGECFLDIDEEEHEHGHESETGRWPTDYQTSIDSARWRPAPSPQENSEASDGE